MWCRGSGVGYRRGHLVLRYLTDVTGVTGYGHSVALLVIYAPLRNRPKRCLLSIRTNEMPAKPTAKAVTASSDARTAFDRASGDSPFRNFVHYTPRPDEAYMNPTQVEHFRNMLHEWRRELMEQVDRTVNHLQDEASNFPDPLDRATQEEELGIELRTRDRERRLIRKINETLDRIEQDDYGYCDTCGVEIGLRRLEARPTATQCVDCKALDELRERQLRG